MPATRARLGVIFFTVFIDLVGFGIVLPILPYYAQSFGARGLLFGALVGAYSGMQFLATAVLGRLSDRVGRRPILLTTMVINAAGYVLFALAGSYVVLFVARLVSGFAGGNISAAQAYVADITTPAERSKGMGIVGAAFGLGFIVGPALGGLAAHYGGHLALLIAGTFGMAVAVAVVPYLDTAAALYAWTIVLAFGNSVVSPAATGLISVFADPTEQGAMLGAAQSLAALGRLTGPELVGMTYDRFSPPWAFLAAGVVMAMAAGATLRLPGGKPEAVPLS